MKYYLPFLIGILVIGIATIVDPDQKIRTSPAFWVFVICWGYGFYQMWKGIPR